MSGMTRKRISFSFKMWLPLMEIAVPLRRRLIHQKARTKKVILNGLGRLQNFLIYEKKRR
jgi:hypothetical protein